jgi:ABC-type branched-subunit amino acid transport system substrate-binding protein
VAPLSGLEAIQGRAYSVGLQLAFNNANKSGSAGGHTFSLVRKDDGGRPEDTLAATNQLLTESKPIALAGYFGNRSIAELVKSGILEKEKIALVGYRTTEIRPDVPYMYSVRAGLRDEITKIAEHLATVGITRLGVFHEDGPGAAALTAAIDEITKKAGSIITARATYPAGTARVSPAIDIFLKTPPQAIIMLATGSAAAGFIEQYRLGGGAAQLFAQSGADIEQLAQRLGEETMQGIAIAQVTPSPYKISGRLAKEFADTVAKTANIEVPPSYAMMEGFIAGKVIVEAARRMGAKSSREAFVAALDTLETDLGGYRLGFKPGMRSGSRFVELSIVTGAGKIRQ